jgi:stromal membrane-associated protein
MDAWGSNDAWSTPDPAPVPPKQAVSAVPTQTYKAPATTSISDDFGGWGSNDGVGKTATMTEDDDFGGWSSAEPVAAPAAPARASAQGGQSHAPAQGNSDDLFGNVWG